MSEYVENILITEIEEVKDTVNRWFEPMSIERYDFVMNLIKLNTEYNPEDIHNSAEYVRTQEYGNTEIHFFRYTADDENLGQTHHILENTIRTDTEPAQKATEILILYDNICKFEDPPVLGWTDDFIDIDKYK
jgi:hypothetical protein